MYYISMLFMIIFNVFYHICQKTITKTINPALSMIITYGIALVTSFILLFFIPIKKEDLLLLKSINWAPFILGIAVAGLEISVLFVYRSGWNISIAAIFANIMVTLLLIPIGIYIYREQISIINILGIFLSIVGLILINKK